MPSGKAPIAESSTLDALLARHWSPRRPVPTGVLSVLTLLFWMVWVYLVLPLVSLLLWFFGVRLVFQQIVAGGYEGLRASLAAYSLVLLVLVGLLALWIAWNVVRYGGDNDRRTVRRAEVTDEEVQKAFRLDDSLLSVLRGERLVRIDLDGDGVVVMKAAVPPRTAGPAIEAGPVIEARPALEAGPNGGAPPQRDRDSRRSG
jgi:poly-beta-1,6-N-acetyl-D-glucosamine biosynthesis protein PgaD